MYITSYSTYHIIDDSDELKNATEEEVFELKQIFDFLRWNISLISIPRGKRTQPNLNSIEDVDRMIRSFLRGRHRKPEVKMPKTVPDPAVELIMNKKWGGFGGDIIAHGQAMAAENALGEFLESYIAKELNHYGWVWCTGELIKGVDFIRGSHENGWTALQVKNRSNSENSSSKAIRLNTNIKKWHRINANNGKTNWEYFPEPELLGVLTEEGFQQYIKDNL